MSVSAHSDGDTLVWTYLCRDVRDTDGVFHEGNYSTSFGWAYSLYSRVLFN